MAAFGELRQRVEGDEVTDADAQRFAVGAGGAIGVQAQLDVVPADGQLVHRGIEGMPGGHQRQYAAAQHAIVGEYADPAAFGKAAGPATHGCQAQAAVVLHGPDTGADGIQVRRYGPVGRVLAALEGGADGAAAGQFKGDTQLFQAFGHVAHDGVGKAGGAGDGEHFQQDFLQVRKVRFRKSFGHEGSWLHSGVWLWGNSRSIKRSATGCGSWLARPTRSLASMNT
ncbi:hypothetical protein D3C76_1014040 [compost metagenome]